MVKGMHRRTILAWAWLAAVIGFTILGIAGIGPVARLETWFAVRTGNLLGANILFLVLVLAFPAIWVLFGTLGRADKAAIGNSAGARQLRRWAAALLVLAGGFLTMALVAGVLAARAPDGREPAVKLAPGTLAQGAAAGRHVALTGAPIERAQARFAAPSRRASIHWTYTGFRPDATRSTVAAEGAEAAPIALFVERAERPGAPTLRRLLPEQETVEGYLIENGLPDHARIVLERENVAIATPHYLLRVGEDGLRGQYYVPLFLGLFFAFSLGVIGMALIAKAAALSPLSEGI